MKMFKVAQGTKVVVIKSGAEWYTKNFVDHSTKNENLFAMEEIVIDPVGKLGPSKNGVTVGGAWAAAGYYGFERDGYILLATLDKVEVI